MHGYLISVITFSGLLLGLAHGQTAAELGAMERFAKQTSARMVWSEEVERISAGAATAIVNAVVMEDTTATPRQIRGIRIDLADGDVKDQVYTAETHLEQAIAEMTEISSNTARFFSDSGSRVNAPNRCFGSGIFLRARREGAHIFGASQCSMNGWFGLIVSTRSSTIPTGPAVFRFTGLDAAPFAAAMTRAKDTLSKR